MKKNEVGSHVVAIAMAVVVVGVVGFAVMRVMK
jgi:hypothetical protein